MQNLDYLVLYLTKKILESDTELPQNLMNRLIKSYPQSSIQEIQNLLHQKFHENTQIPLKSCTYPHCPQCLSISSKCEHGSNLTFFEQNFTKLLSKKSKSFNEKDPACKICKSCRFSNPGPFFLKKTCKCECIFCIKKNLQAGAMNCLICKKPFELSDLLDFFSTREEFFPGLLLKCESCGLQINSLAFSGETCYVCSEFNDFISNN